MEKEYKIDKLGYPTITWRGLTIKSSKDNRIFIYLKNTDNYLYLEPSEEGIIIRDHFGKEIDIELPYD